MGNYDEDLATQRESGANHSPRPPRETPEDRIRLTSPRDAARNDDTQAGYHQGTTGYSQISTRSDEEPEDPDLEQSRLGRSELDPLNYPPAPPGYYLRQHPMRITYFSRLFGVLLAIGTACFSIAAVIDVSTPSDMFQPGRDEQSVADGLIAGMDRSADPCDNFYEYACGSWLRSTKIPLDRSRYSKSFSTVYDRIRLMLKELLEVDLQSSELKEPSKPGMFYASCLDQMGVGGLNTLYLQSFRDDFNALHDSKSVSRLLAKLHKQDSLGLWDIDVSIDERNPTQYALYLGQGGLGLPHRDSYFSTKDADVETRKKYLHLIETMLVTAGKARLIPRQGHDVNARQVLDLETSIANATLPPEDLRDPDKAYNKIEIEKMPDVFAINEYLDLMGIDASSINGTIIVDNPAFFAAAGVLMSQVDSDPNQRRAMRSYLAFHIVARAADKGMLGESMYHAYFQFKQHLYGLKQLPDQWKRCQTLANDLIGEAVGAAFVKKHFPESMKHVAVTVAEKIANAFGEKLDGQDWMDDKTKNVAKEKVAAINKKVGYSTKLDTYGEADISTKSYVNNVVALYDHKFKKEFGRLGKPIDHSQWFMMPQEVNAYYSPTRNEIVFPAGILQPPFFSDAFPDAMNFGGIGAVIGHEMSHGFDDQGRKYDKNGLLTSWWSSDAVKEYENRAKCYVDLFNTYKPRDSLIHVNGELTLGENLADANGVSVAYRAFKSTANNSEDGIPPPNPLLAQELTNDQLFFVAYAQTWCTLYRHESLQVQLKTDPHSPGQFRVQGPLSQNRDFAKAFSCRDSSRYNPTEKCSLWQR